MSSINLLLITLIFACVAGGCGEFRGIPTHGGGKRFDEEQMVVAGSVRRAIADMDVSELRGKKVVISIEAISQDGGGSVSFPGITGINAGVSGNAGNGNVVQITPTGGGTAQILTDNSSSGAGGNANVSYQAQTNFSPTVFSTLPDVAYLKASLEMKARHAGLLPAPADPDVTLYVLVDVLGTNRSRADKFIVSRDTLEARCECTYYAVENHTSRMLFKARRVAAVSNYKETHGWFVEEPQISRCIAKRTDPTELPIDEERKPTTNPTTNVAKKKATLVNGILAVIGFGD